MTDKSMSWRQSPPSQPRLPSTQNLQYNPNSSCQYYPNSRPENYPLQQPLSSNYYLSPYPPLFFAPPPSTSLHQLSASHENKEKRVEIRTDNNAFKAKESKQMLFGSSQYGFQMRRNPQTPGLQMGQCTNLLNLCHNNRLKRETTFLGKLKFWNELPDPSSQLKLVEVKKTIDRLTEYGVSTLEKNWKPEIHAAPDLGIPLDLLDLSVYNPPKDKPPLAPEDEALLCDSDDETPTPISAAQKSGIRIKGRPRDEEIPWLVKTQYVSSISSDSLKQNMSAKQTKRLKGKETEISMPEHLKDREKKIKEIQDSFKAARSIPVHSTNKNLKPVSIVPLLPDIDRLADQFVLARFDGCPMEDVVEHGKPDATAKEAQETQAILKSCMASEDSGHSRADKVLTYMVPSAGELSKGSSSKEKGKAEYSVIREYDYIVQEDDDANDSSTYLISLKDNAARYVPIPTRLNLKKRKSRRTRRRGSK